MGNVDGADVAPYLLFLYVLHQLVFPVLASNTSNMNRQITWSLLLHLSIIQAWLISQILLTITDLEVLQ